MDKAASDQYLIDLGAVRHNIATLRTHLPTRSRILAMIKANAYGTDALTMSKFLPSCGVDILGVFSADEGITLRQAGIAEDIFVFYGSPRHADEIVSNNLQVAVDNEPLAAALAKAATNNHTHVKVHLHIDTGMNRLGCSTEQAPSLAGLIAKLPGLKLEGIMTHFAAAEDPQEDPFTLQQAHTLTNVVASLQKASITAPWIHAANSSGAIRFHFPQFNMVRVGLAIYGVAASEATAKTLNLEPALSLTSHIAGINNCRKGQTIGYGRTYVVTKKKARIATVPLGYFDGYHRHYSSGGCVIIRGHKATIVGHICMNCMMLDVTDIPAAVGDTVLLFGKDPSGLHIKPEDVARQGGSIIHEFIACLGPHIPRIFADGHKAPKKIFG